MNEQTSDKRSRLSQLPPVALWLKIKPYINKTLMSRYFMLAEFLAACAVIAFDLEVPGAIAFAWLVMVTLTFCNDILASLLPLCLMSVFLTDCYNSADTFLPLLWMAVPAALSLLIHGIAYTHSLRVGPNFWGSVAVAAAVTIGGLGTISNAEYFNPTSLYYTGFLGIGMLLIYVAAKSYIHERREYDIFKVFAGIIYAMGMLAVFAVACFYIKDWSNFIETRQLVNFQSSNNLSTVLMIAMPFPCLFVRRNRLHLIGFALIFAGIVLAGSRGGLLMGTIEMFICLLYLCYADSRLWAVYAGVGLAAGLTLYFGFDNILAFYKIESLNGFITQDESRFGLLKRMTGDLKSNVLFGRGLGYTGNDDLYNPTKGAMHWYHMMIPQVIGSLGVCGVFAYAVQLTIRAFSVIRRTNVYKLALGLSYFGLFLMSQVNPGEFCPIPYALLGVLLFVMLEKYVESGVTE